MVLSPFLCSLCRRLAFLYQASDVPASKGLRREPAIEWVSKNWMVRDKSRRRMCDPPPHLFGQSQYFTVCANRLEPGFFEARLRLDEIGNTSNRRDTT